MAKNKPKVAEVPDSPELAEYKENALAKYDSNALLQMLTTGATRIFVEFSGSGDSGQIDDIVFYDEHDDAMPQVDATPKQIVEDWFYEWLERVPFDWVNNEGGGGTVDVKVKTGAIEFRGYENITVQKNYVSLGWDIENVKPDDELEE